MLWTSTRQRFQDEAGPDRAKWAANSEVTLGAHLAKVRSRKSNVLNSGGLSARGRRAVGVKKILTQSGTLADTWPGS